MIFKKKKALPAPESENPEQTADGTMPILHHLKELRTRVMHMFIFFIVCFLASYAFRTEILNLLIEPIEEPLNKYTYLIKNKASEQIEAEKDVKDLNNYSCKCGEISEVAGKNKTVGDGKPFNITLDCVCVYDEPEVIVDDKYPKSGNLISISLPEVFFSELKASLYAALFFSFPYLIIQIWIFAMPALFSSEKKLFWFFAVSGYFSFIVGALFGYFGIFPYGFDFFLSLGVDSGIVPTISIDSYMGFAITLLFIFGLVFELPPVVYVLSRLGICSPKFLIKNARYSLLIIFLASAILTPPDPVTMVFLAAPLCVLYFLSILVSMLAFKKKKEATITD